jgi:sec-independent protein translocase protein TatB
MEFLGVGPSELVFIVIIALIILGPKDMQKAGKTLGKWMRNIVTSDGWKMFQQTSRELQTLPNRLMRDANEELNQISKDINNSISPAPSNEPNTSNWTISPNITPRSLPVPTSPAPIQPTVNQAEPPTTESTSNEGDQQKDE